LFELTQSDIYINLIYLSFGRIIIEYLGIRLWDSDNDDREYLDEDIDEYENLENYIRKEFNKISTRLPTLKEK
jgi:hypothetical protein